LGDFHEHQILETKNCYAMYSGSIERNSFNEIGQDKGFILYDSEAEEDKITGRCRFIKYPHCRPLCELKGNFQKIRKDFGKLNYDDYKDGIVKIKFVGDSKEVIDFATGIEAFKKEVREKINPIHLFHNQTIQDEKQEEEASRVEKEIMEKGHIEAKHVIEVVREIIDEELEDEKEKKEMFELATEIHKEAMGS